MFEVSGTKIHYNGSIWYRWLTQMMTPAMLKNLVIILNNHMGCRYKEGYDAGFIKGEKAGKLMGIASAANHMCIAMDNLVDDVERDNE